MTYFKFAILSGAILVGLTGCVAANFYTKPNMTADSLTIKVGQTVTIVMAAPTKVVTGGNPTLTQVDTGFIYSPKPNQLPSESPAPYFYDGGNLLPGSEPTLFPVDSDLEIVTPITSSSNVPATVAAVQLSGQSQVTFSVKGKSVGTAVIRGGFLNTTDALPIHFKRTPLYPMYDGEITIQIVP